MAKSRKLLNKAINRVLVQVSKLRNLFYRKPLVFAVERKMRKRQPEVVFPGSFGTWPRRYKRSRRTPWWSW